MSKDQMTPQDTEVRALSDNELDSVNGGFLGFLAAGVLLGIAIGYGVAKATS